MGTWSVGGTVIVHRKFFGLNAMAGQKKIINFSAAIVISEKLGMEEYAHTRKTNLNECAHGQGHPRRQENPN
jgi:hypothetical protein